jgi:hypothetical protein
MITLQTALEQSKTQVLNWIQLSPFSRYNELRCDKLLTGDLIWKKENYSTSGRGNTAEGSWLFKYTRFVQPNLEIQEASTGKPAGIFQMEWSGKGKLVLENGQKFDWLPGDRWGQDWQFSQSTKIPILYFQPRKKWLTINAQIRIASEIPDEPTLSLMVLSGWFNLLLSAERWRAGDAYRPDAR